MPKFHGKNGDWAIPVVLAIFLALGYFAHTVNSDKKITNDSKLLLESYGYEDIDVYPKAVGCKFDDVTSFDDRGRVFIAKMPSGKRISGVVCTAMNNVGVVNVNYQEK